MILPTFTVVIKFLLESNVTFQVKSLRSRASDECIFSPVDIGFNKKLVGHSKTWLGPNGEMCLGKECGTSNASVWKSYVRQFYRSMVVAPNYELW